MKIQTQFTPFLAESSVAASLREINRGIEKESLRADASAQLSQLSHPTALGSALFNGWLTTDFSEALVEFVTPVFHDAVAAHAKLNSLHHFVSTRLHEGEALWPSSMPCVLPSDEKIPLAQYGDSNSGLMKTAYRRGLGHRYGRAMQTVAGIHYNFSLPLSYWKQEQEVAAQSESKWQNASLQEYINFRYLGLIRNFRRHYWLLIYLFGSSPVADPSFLQGRKHSLEQLPSGDFYRPNATCLRMGDLGYQSKAQESLFVCYNQLDTYLTTLKSAIKTPYPAYKEIGVVVDGEYQQLSDAILQIENEFYSPIRPKRVTSPGQTPATALTEGGIEYVEVRCLDLDPFEPCGISVDTIAFLDTFLMNCLIADSPLCDEIEFKQIASNQKLTVNEGRLPGLLLKRRIEGVTQELSLQDWSREILTSMEQSASALDSALSTDRHRQSLAVAASKISDPEKTPSAKVLRALESEGQSHTSYMQSLARNYLNGFKRQSMDGAIEERLISDVDESLRKQATAKDSDSVSFETYLANYFDQ